MDDRRARCRRRRVVRDVSAERHTERHLRVARLLHEARRRRPPGRTRRRRSRSRCRAARRRHARSPRSDGEAGGRAVTNARRVGGVVVVAIGLVVGGCSARRHDRRPAIGRAPSRRPQPAGARRALISPSRAPCRRRRAVSDAPLASLVIGAERHPGEVGGFTVRAVQPRAPRGYPQRRSTRSGPAGAELRVELDERATIAGLDGADRDRGRRHGGRGHRPGCGRRPRRRVRRALGPAIWVVSVTITYGEGLGSGAYYWHLIIDRCQRACGRARSGGRPAPARRRSRPGPLRAA